jgi:hypothetical protein
MVCREELGAEGVLVEKSGSCDYPRWVMIGSPDVWWWMDVWSCRSIRESMSSLQLTAENLKKQSAELEADERALESKVHTHVYYMYIYTYNVYIHTRIMYIYTRIISGLGTCSRRLSDRATSSRATTQRESQDTELCSTSLILKGRQCTHDRTWDDGSLMSGVWLWGGQIKKKQTDLERGEKRLKSLQTVRYATHSSTWVEC